MNSIRHNSVITLTVLFVKDLVWVVKTRGLVYE